MKSEYRQKTPCIAVFGTGSDVGKSIVVTALCRCLVNDGWSVAPFKAQNMSNNSGVTLEGLEMGRAQIVQAEAANIAPHTDMNPVLLKPTSDVGSQVVVMGRAVENSTAMNYHTKKEPLFKTACQALDRLKNQYDAVIMEGAGSCAEVNLMANDIVNFRMAEYADAPVILVADIHRGGVFGQIVGTLACLPKKQQDQIAGFIINRFRGDIRLFDDGVKWIEQKTGKPVFGVLPWFKNINIEAEDSVVIESPPSVRPEKTDNPLIGVIRIPHISNFTDFAPFSNIKNINLCFLEKKQNLSEFAAVILPGSKNTRFDLNWLKQTGWDKHLRDYADAGGHLLGICGGYQLMGLSVHDPYGLEGAPGTSEGLGLLPIKTTLKAPKTTTLSKFSWQGAVGTGYEIHMGQTKRLSGEPMVLMLEQNGQPKTGEDGCVTEDGRIMGTYMHGLFDNPAIMKKWLASINLGHADISETKGGLPARSLEYDRLAEHFKAHINTQAILKFLSNKI